MEKKSTSDVKFPPPRIPARYKVVVNQNLFFVTFFFFFFTEYIAPLVFSCESDPESDAPLGGITEVAELGENGEIKRGNSRGKPTIVKPRALWTSSGGGQRHEGQADADTNTHEKRCSKSQTKACHEPRRHALSLSLGGVVF